MCISQSSYAGPCSITLHVVADFQAIRKDCFNIDLLRPADVNNYLDKEKKFTALHFAAHFNRPAIVQMLLEELKAGQQCLIVVL